MEQFLPVAVVLFAVSLNVFSGIILKSLADRPSISYAILAVGVGLVMLLNGLRFIAWSIAHKRYPLTRPTHSRAFSTH